MKILINTSNNLTGGSLQVAISFLNECKAIVENVYIVVLGDNIEKQINKSNFPRNFIFYKIVTSPFYKLSKQLKEIERKENPDRVFTVFGPSYWRPKAKHIMGFANPYYGRISRYITNLSEKDKIVLQIKKIMHSYYMNRDADVIISETQEASDAFRKCFKKVKHFSIVSNNCSSYFWEYKKHIKQLSYPDDEFFYLLTLSNYRPNKNLESIPKVIEELHNRHEFNVRFILTIDNEIFNKKFSSFSNEIINVGPIKAENCPPLYEKCNAMYLPTYLECFSASYPEAMLMERPILTSNLGFARDICKEAAIFFDPDNSDEIAEKIIRLKQSAEMQKALIKKGLERVKEFPNPKEKTKNILNIIYKND